MNASGRLLLVDDEAALAQLLARYLARLGYEVEVCATGEDALEQFLAEPLRYGAVLVDLTLPGISGEETLRRMLECNPALAALVISGRPYSPENLPLRSTRQVRFLQKPFLPRVLVEELGRLLKRTPTARA